MSPYSVKPLFYKGKIAKKVFAKSTYTARISILDDSLKEAFILSLVENIREKVKLGKCEFVLSNIHAVRWAPKKIRAHSVTVKFISPTFFKVLLGRRRMFSSQFQEVFWELPCAYGIILS